MITVRRADGQIEFPDATRVSNDEHNNLAIWGGTDGEELVYLCAESFWIDALVNVEAGT